MFFKKIISFSGVLALLLYTIASFSLLSAVTSMRPDIAFAAEWEPISRGLNAVHTPATGEVSSLRTFREAKLIVDTSLAYIQSKLSVEPGLIQAMVRRRFNWQTCVLQPLYEALLRLEEIKKKTCMGSSSSDGCVTRDASLLRDPSLTYMRPHLSTKTKMKTVTAFMRLRAQAKVSTEGRGISEAMEGSEEGLTDAVEGEDVVDGEREDMAYIDSASGEVLSGRGSGSPADLDKEFEATDTALRTLEAAIAAALSGGGRTIVVTRKVTLEGKPTVALVEAPLKKKLSFEEAMARLEELMPEIRALMDVLRDETSILVKASIVALRAKSKLRSLTAETTAYEEMAALADLLSRLEDI